MEVVSLLYYSCPTLCFFQLFFIETQRGWSICINLVPEQRSEIKCVHAAGTGDIEWCCCNFWVHFCFSVPPRESDQAADKVQHVLLQAALLPSAQDRKAKAPQELLHEEIFL